MYLFNQQQLPLVSWWVDVNRTKKSNNVYLCGKVTAVYCFHLTLAASLSISWPRLLEKNYHLYNCSCKTSKDNQISFYYKVSQRICENRLDSYCPQKRQHWDTGSCADWMEDSRGTRSHTICQKRWRSLPFTKQHFTSENNHNTNSSSSDWFITSSPSLPNVPLLRCFCWCEVCCIGTSHQHFSHTLYL